MGWNLVKVIIIAIDKIREKHENRSFVSAKIFWHSLYCVSYLTKYKILKMTYVLFSVLR